MAFGAVISHLPCMNILMTGSTICRSVFERFIFMAVRTWNGCMFPIQLEWRLRMIESGFLPFGGFMTRRTISSQFAQMRIILFMTGETILGRTFEDIVDMAFLAVNCLMAVSQFEGGKIMVEMNRLPIIRRMTLGAVRSQRTFMWIVICVAGGASLGGRFHVIQTMSFGVAILASHSLVFTD